MFNQICQHQQTIQASGILLYAAFEFWLGKTDKVQAGSTFELIFNVLKTLFLRRK